MNQYESFLFAWNFVLTFLVLALILARMFPTKNGTAENKINQRQLAAGTRKPDLIDHFLDWLHEK